MACACVPTFQQKQRLHTTVLYVCFHQGGVKVGIYKYDAISSHID